MKKGVIVIDNKFRLFEERLLLSKRFDFGSLLVVGGSKKYSGCLGLAAIAAYRSGVDLVEIAAPKRAANIAATFSPDIISWPLKGEMFTSANIPEVLRLLENKTSLLIGNGIGRTKQTKKAVVKLLKHVGVPCVIDAEAIYAFSNNHKKIKSNFIFLPHSFEFLALTGKVAPKDLDKRIALVEKQAKKLNCTIVLKGNPDVISNGKVTAINKTGNPYMTVGGTGDTLAGITASLLAQKAAIFKAACLACYVNGRAGDLVAAEKKQGLMASDLLNKIPSLF